MNKKIVSIILLLTVVIFVIVILFFRRKKAQAQNELDLTPQQLEAIKNDLQRQINDAHSAIGAEMYSQEVSRHQIIKFYNDLLLINSRGGVSRGINMTPDEYYYHFIARAPRKASSMRLVTDVYSRVYFGNEIPNQQVWLRYCEAVEGSLLT